jgi:hypothetical protein
MIQPIIIRNILAINQSIAYTPEDVANKQTNLTASATKYPTVNAVNAGLASKLDTSDLKTINSNPLTGGGDLVISTPPIGGNIGDELLKDSDTSGDFSWYPKKTDSTRTVNILGGNLIAQSHGVDYTQAVASLTMVSQTAYFGAVYLPAKLLVSGVRFFQRVQGNFTGSNFNGVALYSISGGVITRIAISADDQNIWKNTANSFTTIVFAGSVTLNPGVYFVGMLYSQSAVVTAPQIAQGTALPTANLSDGIYPSSIKAFSTIASQTSLASTYNMSALTSSVNPVYFGLY